MQNEIFGISLNEEGRDQIVRLHKKLKLVFIAAIVWSAFSMLSLLVQVMKVNEFSGRTNSQLLVIYSFWALHFLIFPVQAYYYFAFSKRMRISIEVQDSDKFNSSFRLLVINATLVLFALLIDFSNLVYNVLWPLLRLM